MPETYSQGCVKAQPGCVGHGARARSEQSRFEGSCRVCLVLEDCLFEGEMHLENYLRRHYASLENYQVMHQDFAWPCAWGLCISSYETADLAILFWTECCEGAVCYGHWHLRLCLTEPLCSKYKDPKLARKKLDAFHGGFFCFRGKYSLLKFSCGKFILSVR